MSKRIRTHYDNLKVSPDAPIEVIRAAYRSLCKKYHPDQNAANPDAHRIMSLINHSYHVLSDPKKRREHDEWIAAHSAHNPPAAPAEPPPATPTSHSRIPALIWFATLTAALGAAWWGTEHMRNNASPTPPPISSEHWPPYARYLAGYPLIKQNGNGMAKIDNRANPSAVFIELHRGENRTALRTFYIPARADFTLFELDHLPYRLRYRQISTGTWSENTFRLDNASTPMHIVLQHARPDTP